MPFSLADLANAATIAAASAATWRTARRWRRPWAERPGAQAYSVGDIKKALRWYVLPDVIDVNPSELSEPAEAAEVPRRSLFRALDDVMRSTTAARFVLLLGDSGTGKTSALINYYVRLVRRPIFRYSVVLVPLSDDTALEMIGDVSDKGGTLLLLDGLDEFLRPGETASKRFDALARQTAQFAKVVVSCRTQYFESDEDVPQLASVTKRSPRLAGERPVESVHRLFLAPFTDGQIRQYLRKRYRLYQFLRKRRARAVIAAAPLLAVRPMLLSFLDDLASTVTNPSTFDLYEAGVEGWLHREYANNSDVSHLREFSRRIALHMWERLQSVVTADEATNYLSRESPLDRSHLSGRSLLNRDSLGRWKFAHRSIMEFFVAERVLARSAVPTAQATDQVAQFVLDRLKALPRIECRLVAEQLPDAIRGAVAALVRQQLPVTPSSTSLLTVAAFVLFSDLPFLNAAHFRIKTASAAAARAGRVSELEVLTRLGGPFDFDDTTEPRNRSTTDFWPAGPAGVKLSTTSPTKLYNVFYRSTDRYFCVPIRVLSTSVDMLAFRVPRGRKMSSVALRAFSRVVGPA